MRASIFVALVLGAALTMSAAAGWETDTLQTAAGDLRITFIGHGSLWFESGGKAIYVDPDGRLADFSVMPKADLILVSHPHGDHFDPKAIAELRHAATEIFVSASCLPQPAGSRVLRNGDRCQSAGILIEAVPAYNLAHRRPDGRPYHPRGEGNGYVLSFPGLRVYVAGDTENIPEMKELKSIDVAFLPMNIPYTMTPEMTALAAKVLRPRILYPYHFSDTDPQRLISLLRDEPAIEVRVRKMN